MNNSVKNAISESRVLNEPNIFQLDPIRKIQTGSLEPRLSPKSGRMQIGEEKAILGQFPLSFYFYLLTHGKLIMHHFASPRLMTEQYIFAIIIVIFGRTTGHSVSRPSMVQKYCEQRLIQKSYRENLKLH